MQFITNFNKSYLSVEEFNMRLAHFESIDKFIDSQNANPAHTFVSAHNKFSDWAPHEFKRLSGL